MIHLADGAMLSFNICESDWMEDNSFGVTQLAGALATRVCFAAFVCETQVGKPGVVGSDAI